MKKSKKRIASIIGIILVLSLYIVLFVSAIFAKDDMPGLFAASFFLALVIPIMLWWFIAVYKWVHKKSDKDNDDLSNNK